MQDPSNVAMLMTSYLDLINKLEHPGLNLKMLICSSKGNE